MMIYIIQIVVTSLILLLMAKIVKGVEIDSWGSALFAAFILGLINAFVKPVMVFLTIPLTIITFGLFLLVINALVLQLVATLSPGVRISGFGQAVLGSIVLTVLNMLVMMMIGIS
ncbi:MAG: phage holin family protein [Gammaproteobacteria bacterium]|nr:MAG: phage holin family protein [Gammaproteobacteria bacterium]